MVADEAFHIFPNQEGLIRASIRMSSTTFAILKERRRHWPSNMWACLLGWSRAIGHALASAVRARRFNCLPSSQPIQPRRIVHEQHTDKVRCGRYLWNDVDVGHHRACVKPCWDEANPPQSTLSDRSRQESGRMARHPHTADRRRAFGTFRFRPCNPKGRMVVASATKAHLRLTNLLK